MVQENYVEGCSMQRPPLLEPNGFCFWKARFETYVKSKYIDLWQVIQNGDFYFEVEDEETKLLKETSYELLKDEQKKKLGKNNEAKMTLYNALPRKEYERGFMCKIAKEDGWGGVAAVGGWWIGVDVAVVMVVSHGVGMVAAMWWRWRRGGGRDGVGWCRMEVGGRNAVAGALSGGRRKR
ncbi:hypothetical protein Tco_1374447 [Tanacetum coccineum]